MAPRNIMKKGAITNCLYTQIWKISPEGRRPMQILDALTEVFVLGDCEFDDNYYVIQTAEGIEGCVYKGVVAIKQEDST